MPGQVKVDDFEVFRLFRVALLKFAQAAEQALANADGQIVGMHSWLETEQSTYWQGQLRKRREAVTMAREEVRKKTLYKDSTGHTPSAVDEQKALARCVAAVAQAEEKILAVRKWLPRLEKETELYRGGVSRLSADVGGEIPRAVALLDRLAVRLEEYVQIETPAGGFAESATVGAEAAAAAPIGVESMSRGGEGREPAGESQRQENQSPAATLPAVDGESGTAPPLPADPTPATEGRHVADGE